MNAHHKGRVNINKYKVLTTFPNHKQDEETFASLEDIKLHIKDIPLRERKTLLIEVYENHELVYHKEVGSSKIEKV